MSIPAYAEIVVESLQSIAASQAIIAGGGGGADSIAYTFTSTGVGVRDVRITVQKADASPRAFSPVQVLIQGAAAIAASGFAIQPSANQVFLILVTDTSGHVDTVVTGPAGTALTFVAYNISSAPTLAAAGSTIP